MAKSTTVYRPASGQRPFPGGRCKMWLARDHVLAIKDRAFREIYARIYWNDVQAILLYSLDHPRRFMLAFEIACVLAAAVSAPLLVSAFWGSIYAGVFVAWYGLWRLTRPNWACEISTRLSAYRFPLRPSLSSSRRVVEELKGRVESTQLPYPADSSVVETTGTAFLGNQAGAALQEPVLVWHAITFALGLLAPLTKVILVAYYGLLVLLYFRQQDFEFPFAIRAAAVMSQILALLQISFWLLYFQLPFLVIGARRLPFNMEFSVLTILFSLFGIAAIYHRSLQQSKHQTRSTSLLGLS